MAQNAGKKHVVSSNSFKPASPMKHSVGLGDYYGTIGGKIPYEPVRGRDWGGVASSPGLGAG
jgi:hypothetical protein